MKLTKIILVIFPVIVLAGIISCDQRGGSITGPTVTYTVDLVPFDTLSLPDELIQLGCFVYDGTDQQVADVLIHFEVVGFGSISESRESSTDSIDGMKIELYFQPLGDYGDVEVIATVYDELNASVVAATDTTTLQIVPYELEIWPLENLLLLDEETSINCRVLNPFNFQQVGDIKLAFSVLNELGTVSPTAESDATDPSGLQSNVVYTAPNNMPGVAQIIAVAKYNYAYSQCMGSDTTEITVVEN